jgi:hypothetical protein
MTARRFATISLLSLAAMAGGCADNNNLLSTASVAPDKTVVAAKVDPACVALSNQIDTLRAEGSVDRLEKAAAGKTSNVQVKRASLAKQAELNKANADFQTKCGPQIPKAQTAQAAPAAAAATSQVASTSTTTATAAAGSTTQPVKAAAATAAQTAVQTAPKN